MKDHVKRCPPFNIQDSFTSAVKKKIKKAKKKKKLKKKGKKYNELSDVYEVGLHHDIDHENCSFVIKHLKEHHNCESFTYDKK